MQRRALRLTAAALALSVLSIPATAQTAKPRARDLGVPFDGTPGPQNAITDVRGVTVGHTTIIKDLPPDAAGAVAVRTGVTAVLPRGLDSIVRPAFGAWFSLNGNGEMTGTAWIDESGFVEGPILITNTHSVGVVRDATIKWLLTRQKSLGAQVWWGLPVVAETWDGWLNDINGFHVKDEHVFRALETATDGRVAEGGVGGGTGMICYGFKGGIGTSSRTLRLGDATYTVGVLLQANFGGRPQLTVAGVPVGREIPDLPATAGAGDSSVDRGSVIVVVGTDAPLVPHQLRRLARRVTMGLARTGSVSGNASGDLFIAFSTANAGACRPDGLSQAEMLGNDLLDPIFAAVVQATEESVVNALVAGEAMTGQGGHRVLALPHDRLQDVLRRYNRLALQNHLPGRIDPCPRS
ncbi:MAG TPA: P1 family peptidase [Acidobacteriota bacterium]|nr:P1 family peptidase [Acidobacteriota bacterium]